MATRKDMTVVAMMVLALLALSGVASAATCNAGQLAVCASAITTGSKPSTACCSNLRAQQGCFCQFAKNPVYGRYINNPYASQTIASCGIARPRC